MAVYVDRLPDNSSWGMWRNGAHMLANNLDELLARRAAA